MGEAVDKLLLRIDIRTARYARQARWAWISSMEERALYDAVKDVAALHSPTLRLCRMSVWDRVGDALLGDALAGAVIDLAHLAEFIRRRTISASPT